MSLYILLLRLETVGDKTKFTQIYEMYERRMFWAAYDILKNKHDAEDAVQSAFEYVARSFEKFKTYGKSQLEGNLILATQHRAINIIKSQKKYVLTSFEHPEYFDKPDLGYELPLPGASLAADVLKKLPPQYRQIILLRYGQDMKTRDMALLLGLKVDTLQKQLKRARKMMEELAKEQQQLDSQREKEVL